MMPRHQAAFAHNQLVVLSLVILARQGSTSDKAKPRHLLQSANHEKYKPMGTLDLHEPIPPLLIANSGCSISTAEK